MNRRFLNPHTFDMNSYYSGQMFVLGGKDIEREEKEKNSKQSGKDKKISHELDWSFLKKTLVTKRS